MDVAAFGGCIEVLQMSVAIHKLVFMHTLPAGPAVKSRAALRGCGKGPQSGVVTG